MLMGRGYRMLTGVAMLCFSACAGYSQSMTGAAPMPPLTGASSAPGTPASAANPAPTPLPQVATRVEPPPFEQTAYVIRCPAIVPSAPSATPEPRGPVVELRPLEPHDPPDSSLVEAVRSYEARLPQQAAAKLAACDGPSREVLTRLLPLAIRLSDGSASKADPQDVAALIEQVNTALAPLRARAALEIPKLCFCRPLTAPARFGAYERLDENHRFRPGETVGLYMELRNFACLPHNAEFATHVASSVEIHDAGGNVVFRFDCERTEPSLSPRQDYCHVGRFALPALPPGAYTLWLKATDVPTGRNARRSLDFRVATEKS